METIECATPDGPDQLAGMHGVVHAHRPPLTGEASVEYPPARRLRTRSHPRVENEKAGFSALKRPDNARAPLKQTRDIRCRTIAEPYPDAFRRRTEKHGPLPEILILGNDHEPVCGGMIPNIGIVRVR